MAAPASSYKRLFELYATYPHLVHGDAAKGEIEVVIDPEQIARIETIAQQALLQKGRSSDEAFEWSRAGVVSEDAYFIQVRDAVKFPNGSTGLYNRQLERSALEGSQGAVALPLLEDGRILFNYTHRHATRSWGMELARGFSKPKEPPLQTARRELEEETGKRTSDPIPLGVVAPNTGAAATTPSIYLCPITNSDTGAPRRNKETISKNISFTPQQVADALVNGYFTVLDEQIPFIDGFSFAALLKAHAAGHIVLPKGVKATEQQSLPSSE